MKRIAILTIGLSILTAVAFLSGCASQKSPGYVSSIDREDQVLQERVNARIQADRVTARSMARVEVDYGFATIFGEEDDPAVLARIVSIIRNTPGIKGVEKAE